MAATAAGLAGPEHRVASADRLAGAILSGWLVAAIILTLVSLPALATMRFPDPDDAMRLAEVRDWLAGQSWWDVSQHRLGGGAFAMHWSRLVDLPLAAVLAPLEPLVGADLATRVAITVVPLLTLLAIMAAVAAITAQLAGPAPARLAILLTALAVPIVYQARPLRIDHHGWQIALAAAAVALLLRPPAARNGAAAGLALAALVTISLEGLPVTALIAGVVLIGWALAPDRRAQAAGFAAALLAGLAALHLVTRGPGWAAPACDAVAPAWLAAAGVALAGALAVIGLAPRRPLLRLTGLAAAGAAGLATLLALAPECTRGPFATLDPLVARLWYRNVSEGMPVWAQVPGWAVMTVGLPIVGLAGAFLAWRRADADRRAAWALLIAVAAPAFLLSLLVIRTGGTANALAVPGAAVALHRMLARARSIGPLLPRIAATAGALLLASPGLAGGMALTLAGAHGEAAGAPPGRRLPACDSGADVAALAALPRARLFAPVDVTPQILATTRHEAIGAGYHRNSAAMARVFHGFLAPPGRAQAIVAGTGARYLVACPDLNETNLFAQAAPDGLWARLDRGEQVAWLRPVPIAGSPVRAWAIVPPQGPLPPRRPGS